MFLSIVIAICNEEGSVKELTERIYNSMNSLRVPFELIYIVDGTDSSIDILKKIKKLKKNLVLSYSPKLRGFNKAFLKGFSIVSKKATHILTMDGDLNHQPEEIERLIYNFKKTNADIVIGSRYVKQGKVQKIALWKKLLSIFANFVIRLIFGMQTKDKTSGFRLYKKEVIDTVTPLCISNGFEFLFEILVLSKKSKFKVTEVPITLIARVEGQSKYKLCKAIIDYLKLVFRHYRNNRKAVN